MIIDFRVRVPLRDAPTDPEVPIPDFMSRYSEVFPKMMRREQPTFDQLLERATDAKIDVCVIQAELELPPSAPMNDRVAELVARDPQRIVGFAGINPTESNAYQELVRAVDVLKLRGINLQPWAIGVPITDPIYDVVWETAVARGIPVTIHCGVNFRVDRNLDLGNPMYVDQIATRFPDLPLVINHGGWPWIDQAMAIVWRHRNVYIEFGAVRPRELSRSNGLWGRVAPMLHGWLGERTLLATDWPMLDFTHAVQDFEALEIAPEVRQNIMGENARRLLKL